MSLKECPSYHIWRQIILVGNATIGYYVVVEEYQHAFGKRD